VAITPTVVQNIKDTIFWKQFTTCKINCPYCACCSEYQRYNFLKAIHNPRWPELWNGRVVQNIKDTIFWKQFTTDDWCSSTTSLLFRISKIQFFESNSQLAIVVCVPVWCCSEYQRYNFLKAIHNGRRTAHTWRPVVQNIKDTIFWKQFTTKRYNYNTG